MPETDTVAEPPTVDLSNCDREPIHILGRVQDYGCLVAVSSDWMITHASQNCESVLGRPVQNPVGTRMIDFVPEGAMHDLRTQMQVLGHQRSAARMFAYPLFGDQRLFDISIHESDRHIVFEFEPRATDERRADDAGTVHGLIARIQRHETVEKMSFEAARGLKALSGFDRVMVYRFEEDDSGTVIAEALEPGLDPFLGLRYPASDIPKKGARTVYAQPFAHNRRCRWCHPRD